MSTLHYVSSTTRLSGNATEFEHRITIPANHDRISLISVNFPKSYYNVIDGYNTFFVDLTEYIITPGMYDTQTFISELVDLVPNLTLSLSQTTGKLTFSHPTASTLSFPDSSKLFHLFGFDHASTNTFTAQSLTSTNIINFQRVNQCYINSSLVSDRSAETSSSLLHTFSVNQDPHFKNISFTNPCPLETSKRLNLPSTSSDDFSIIGITANFSFLDEDGIRIDLNGLEVFQLVFVTYRKNDLYTLAKNYINFKIATYHELHEESK